VSACCAGRHHHTSSIEYFESLICLVAGGTASAPERVSFMGSDHDDGTCPLFKQTNHAHSDSMMSAFHTVFGLKTFRKNQLEAVNAALLGNDCFVLMPTGYNESRLVQHFVM